MAKRSTRNKNLNKSPNLGGTTKEATEFSGLADKLLSKFEDLSGVLSKIADTMVSINGTMDLTAKTTRKFVTGAQSGREIFDGMSDTASRLTYSLEDTSRHAKSFGDYMLKNELISKALNVANDDTNEALTKSNTLLQSFGESLGRVVESGELNNEIQGILVNTYGNIVDIQGDLIANQKTSKKLWDDTIKGQVDISTEMTKIKEIRDDILDNEKLLLKTMETADTKTKKRLEQGLKFLGQQKELVKAREAELVQYNKTSSILKKNQSTVDAMTKGITSGLSKIPGGEHLAKALKVDGLADTIKKKLSDGVGSGTGKLASGLLGTVGKFVAGGAFVGAILGPVIHLLGEVDGEISKIGKEFGISRKEADHLHHSTIDLANEMQVVGVNSEQVLAGVKLISEAMGGIDIAHQLHEGNAAAKQLVKDATLLTEKFGMSADEVKNIHTLSTITGKSMGQLTMEATTLGKGLMTNKEAMKTLASIPKSVAIAFKGGTQELIKAAQKAKMLGMELGRTQEIGDGMLNIEESLGKEMEARALTGRNLNLDAARMLALQGDTAGLQDEILKQAGSMEEFQKMNRIQQKAFADAMGMTVDEMTGMLSSAQKLKDIGMDSAKAEDLQSKNAEELRKIMADTSNEKQKAYIEELAKQKESASIQERMNNIMKKLQEKLSAILTPLLEIVHGFLDSATAGDNLNGMIDGIVGSVKMIIPLISTVAGMFFGIVGAVSSIVKFFQKFNGSTKDAAGNIKPVEAGFGNVLLILGAIGSYFFGSKLLAKGMDMLKDKAADVGKTIMDKIGGSMGKVSDKASKMMPGKGKTVSAPKGKGKGGGLGDSIADFVNKIDAKKLMMSAAAILILAAALWVAAKAFQEFGSVSWEGIAKGVVGLLALVGVAFLIDKIKGQIIMGSVALLVLGAALLVMAIGFEKFGGMDWGAIAKGVVAIAAVAGVAVLLGMVAPLAIAGAAALLILGVAVLSFGAGMYLLGAAVEKIAPLIEGLFAQFTKLLSLDPTKLPLIAVGIIAIAAALGTLGAAAGAGGVAAGVGSAVAGLFGSDGPMEMVMKISEKIQPQKLSDTAKSIRELADAFKYFAAETAKLADFDVDKIDAIIEKMEDVKDAQSSGLGGAITGAAKAITGFVGNIFGSSEEQKTSPVQGGASGGNDKDKLDTVIQLLSTIAGSANQPTIIKFGDKTVEEIKSQLNFKKAYNVNVDNTYGRTT